MPGGGIPRDATGLFTLLGGAGSHLNFHHKIINCFDFITFFFPRGRKRESYFTQERVLRVEALWSLQRVPRVITPLNWTNGCNAAVLSERAKCTLRLTRISAVHSVVEEKNFNPPPPPPNTYAKRLPRGGRFKNTYAAGFRHRLSAQRGASTAVSHFPDDEARSPPGEGNPCLTDDPRSPPPPPPPYCSGVARASASIPRSA